MNSIAFKNFCYYFGILCKNAIHTAKFFAKYTFLCFAIIMICMTLITMQFLNNFSKIEVSEDGAKNFNSFIREIQRPNICFWPSDLIFYYVDAKDCDAYFEMRVNEITLRKLKSELKRRK